MSSSELRRPLKMLRDRPATGLAGGCPSRRHNQRRAAPARGAGCDLGVRFPVRARGGRRVLSCPAGGLERALRSLDVGGQPAVIYCHPYEFAPDELAGYPICPGSSACRREWADDSLTLTTDAPDLGGQVTFFDGCTSGLAAQDDMDPPMPIPRMLGANRSQSLAQPLLVRHHAP